MNLKRLERRILTRWVRFAKAHRHSSRVPFILFLILFLDGFLVFIPSLVCVIAATTISPHRWLLYGLLMPLAATCNNTIIYLMAKHFPSEWTMQLVGMFGLDLFWDSAREALQNYGPFATFIGALIGLPTQLMMALIGFSELKSPETAHQIFGATFLAAISIGLVGHCLKSLTVTAITRFGWMKLENKIEKSNKS